jgi:hypothetical protein
MLLVNNTCALCGINEIMVEKTCQCKPGYFRISGKCIACNVNAFFNGITCICFRYYSGDGFQCTKSVTSTADLTQSLAPKGTYSAQGGAIILTWFLHFSHIFLILALISFNAINLYYEHDTIYNLSHNFTPVLFNNSSPSSSPLSTTVFDWLYPSFIKYFTFLLLGH